MHHRTWIPWTAIAVLTLTAATAVAQTGVDDDRVSLPEGPGSLEGIGENIEIDPNMGSMRYNVGIDVPGGVGGLTPATGLNYSSSAGSSILGVGWSMPTMSIERMTLRGSPRYDATDTFAVDGGDELVQISSENGKQVYRARFEGGFARYTWHEVGGGEDGYFTAEYPDGAVGYFGANAQGETVASARSVNPNGGTYKYHLVEKRDVFGNRIEYSYQTLGGNWPLVSEISYAFDGDTPLYQVQYTYEERDDKISDAGSGYEELLGHRLTGVKVLAETKIVREYVLSYEDYASSGGFSRLENVKRYGVGGVGVGPLYPVEFSFGYSKALGVMCEGDDCDKPYLISMGQAGEAAGLATGKATLVDLNADGLPDVVDTTDPGKHRVLINRLQATDQGFVHTFEAAMESASGTGTAFGLGDAITQTADVNGDGLSDMFNARSGATLLSGYGMGDWAGQGASLNVDALSGVDMAQARFIDYNNDKLVDVITSDAATTTVYENLGDRFDAKTIDPIGVTLTNNPSVQFADMNGDGYNDVVEVLGDGTLRYRLNYGWGKWSTWRASSSISVPLSERDLVDLEDLNGDGLSDVVVVTATQVKYAINRNGSTFDAFRTITSADVDGDLPERAQGDKVLYADMNANGSEDVVWFASTGEVQYLELFPVRPNLLARIDNHIGFLQNIEYTTSAEEEARARAAGEAWTKSLSIPMNIVGKTDTFVTLTGSEDGSGLHDVDVYTYRNGFYDGIEKQFRGFEKVVIKQEAATGQEGGDTTMTFNLGEEKPHFNGLMLSQIVRSGERVIREITNSYEECVVAGVPSPAELSAQGRLGIFHPCQTRTETIIKEGAAEAQWKTTRSESEYDGYGNVTKSSNWGVIDVTGDESFTETTFHVPGAGERWLLGLPLLMSDYAIDGGAIRTETKYYYDGEVFVGTQSGLTHGFLTRQTVKVDDDTTLTTLRAKRDERGNIAEVYDANGDPGEPNKHRRVYVYDARGLFLTNIDVHIDEGHLIRRATQYDAKFQRITEATDWLLIQDGMEASARNTSRYDYDDFGRQVASYQPGDNEGTPSLEYTYELADPFSRIIMRGRRVQNGPLVDETSSCMDGRGRAYQTRRKVSQGRYHVSGFQVLNSRGAAVEIFQPYESDQDACEADIPSGVLAGSAQYDALFRPLETQEPGADIYGEAVKMRTSYLPLATIVSDSEDLDANSPHFDTPTVTYTDGLGRTTNIERTLTPGDTAVYQLHYDETGSFSGYTDPSGNRHVLLVDLAGRVTTVRNPTTGEMRYTHDALGNITSQTDARGVTTEFSFDGGSRLTSSWDAADPDATRISYHYDTVPEGCPVTECTNPANRMAQISYPTPFGRGFDRVGYDARQRVVFQGRVFGDAIAMNVRTEYDNMDRPTVVTHGDATKLEWGYDLSGRPTSIKGFIDEMTYTDRGLLERITYGNASTSEFYYDALLRLESRINKDGAGKVIEGMVLDRDRVGNITSVMDMGEIGAITHEASFGYDAWYRVVESAQKTEGVDDILSYAFDKLDRITKATSSRGESSAAHVGDLAYDAARPLALAQAGPITMAYNQAGQMTARGEMTLDWDFLNRITKITRPEGAEDHIYGASKARVAVLGEDRTVFYGFGNAEIRDGVSHVYIRPHGDRLAKSTSTSLMTQLFGDADEDGVLTAHDAWATREDRVGALTSKHALGAVAARVLADDAGATNVFLHADTSSSIVSATDEGGQVVGRRAYSATGVLREEQGHVDVYGFTGQEHNAFSGLIQFKMRDLDPWTTRWTSFDPSFILINPAQMSAFGEATTGYAYVGNNFINVVDPTGLNGEGNEGGNGNAKKKKDVSVQSNQQKGNDGPEGDVDTGAMDDVLAGMEIDNMFSFEPSKAKKQGMEGSVSDADSGPNGQAYQKLERKENQAGEGMQEAPMNNPGGATNGGPVMSRALLNQLNGPQARQNLRSQANATPGGAQVAPNPVQDRRRSGVQQGNEGVAANAGGPSNLARGISRMKKGAGVALIISVIAVPTSIIAIMADSMD